MGVDAAGNCYLAGAFGSPSTNATIDFGTTNLTSAGGDDGYLAKYNSAGVCQWARQIGGVRRDGAIKVAVRRNGDAYLVGDFSRTASIGSTNLVSSGGTDIYIARFDTSGQLQWIRAAGSATNDSAYSVALNAEDGCFVTGSFQDTAQFGGTNISSQGEEDAFLAKYRSNGTLEWVQVAGGPDFQFGTDVATDSDGNVCFVGGFFTGVSLGSTNLNLDPADSGGGIFIARYDAGGNLLWARKAGDGNSAGAGRVAIDSGRNIYVSGSFSGQYQIDGQILNGGIADVFFASYNAAGQAQWSKMFGGPDTDGCADIAVDQFSNSYLVGHFRGTAFIETNSLTSRGNSDVLIAKYNQSGQLQWVRTAGGTMSDVGLAGVLDGPYRLYVAGEFGGTANFGGISVTASDALLKPFLARLEVGAELRITRQSPHVLLSWATNLGNFLLQTTLALAPNDDWSSVPTTPAVVGRDYVVTNEIGGGREFFRLKGQ